MLSRLAQSLVETRLASSPAVVLLGPRQVGKTTLASAIAGSRPNTIFLDLEREGDRAVLANPELFLPSARGHLVVLDEVQQAPELFRALRPEIDADRRPGRFLLLGSASGELLRQSAESLAGRAATCELTPLLAAELPTHGDLIALQRLWLRGGFPLSWLADSDGDSYAWRRDFIGTLLARDLPAMGVRAPAETLRRFWTMLAHLQGQLFNASQLGVALGGASHTTASRYLDLLVDALLVRRLQPYFVNIGKRLVKSPKVYLRDSGLLHALLGAVDVPALQGHPIAGASWEGFVVEQVAAALPPQATLHFYRTAAGAELDLVIERGTRRLGVEIKFSVAPKPTRGFWHALKDLEIEHAFIVAPVERGYPIADGVEVVPASRLDALLQALGPG